MDNEKNKELFKKIFWDSKNFAIEISAAASINDIVALWDTFHNAGNYGVAFHNNSLEKLIANKALDTRDFKLMFIDHLPNARNGVLTQLNLYKIRKDEKYQTTPYSPRNSLINSIHEKPQTLIELAKNSKEKGFSKQKIIKDVYQRICNDQQWDKF